MRWRPTLAALGVLAVAAALLVAMSSASSPTVGDPGSETAAAGRPPQPGAAAQGGDVSSTGGDADPGAPDSAARDGGTGTEGPSAAVAPAAADPDGTAVGVVPAATTDGAASSPASRTTPDDTPPLCPEPSDPFFSLYVVGRDCFWLLIPDEQHQGLTEEELAQLGSIPFVAGSVAESLGRPAQKIRHGPPGEPGAPRLYLTFDDGPSTTWTRPILNLLDRYGARATFFPVGAYASLNFHLIEEISARGHTIGTHLWSHEEEALYNEDLFRQELRASAELLGDYLTNCLRTPYGITSESIFEWAGDEGFEIVLWGDVDPLDWQAPETDELTTRILNGVRPGTILLLHERTGANTLAALDAVLGALHAAGWQFDVPICPLQ